MNLSRSAGLLMLAWVSATAALADVRGVTALPVFTPGEIELINRDSRLILATKSCPWRLRQALDAWEDIRQGTARHAPESVLCSHPTEDSVRASGEGPFDLLQILKEAAGQGTSRHGTGH